MIIHKDFVWLHIPKTNGTVTHDNICKYISQKDIQYKFLIHQPNKHLSYNDLLLKFKRYNLENKIMISNFRKLPRWIMSYNVHVARARKVLKKSMIINTIIDKTNKGLIFVNPKKLTVECDILRYYKLNEYWQPADIYVDYFFSKRMPDLWIRQEFFDKDFMKAISRFSDHDFSKKPLNTEIKRTNSPEKYMSIDKLDLQTIYKNNPKWHDIEKKIYPKP